jgi:peptide/nickel transport system permease protein
MRYVLRRLGFFVLTLWAALTINFLIPHLLPGDPVSSMMARYKGRLQGESLEAVKIALGIETEQSLLSQYFIYLGNCARLDFGLSLTYFPAPVSQLVADALPWTLGLIGLTTLLAFALGTGIGAVAAWRRDGRIAGLLPTVFVVIGGLPYFWIAMMLILVFAVLWPVLPTAFGYELGLTPGWNGPFMASVLEHAILPAAAIVLTSIGGWALTMRNTMVTTLAEDYIRMARAKGLPNRRIMVDYAARNAVLPSLTGCAMSLGFVVSGSVLVEYVFAYPGLGFLLVRAVRDNDFALMQALFLMITVAVLIALLVADIITAVLDPRTRSAR